MFLKRRAWSIRSIVDEDFRGKFGTVPRIIEDWVGAYVKFKNAEILDFGCGEGASALGLALQCLPRRVVGVDIMPDPERCLENLRLHRVRSGCLHREGDRFDLIYSWSTFEHIDERVLDDVTKLLYEALKPTGVMLVQIAPLYYSAEGSHLMKYVDEAWGHLLNQHNAYYNKLVAATKDSSEELCAALWSTYRTLNRITASEPVELLKRHGFQILKEYTTQDGIDPPHRLKKIFDLNVLMTNQVVVLVKKTK